MAEIKNSDGIDVNLPAVEKGEIKFLTSKAAFVNPAPDKLKRILTAIRYTLISLITLIAGTDLLSGYQVKVTTFCLGLAILLCGGIELGTGVKPLPEEDSK